jgi:hypothetical protein
MLLTWAVAIGKKHINYCKLSTWKEEKKEKRKDRSTAHNIE